MLFILSTVYDLTILFDMRDIAPHNKHNNFYVIDDIHRRNSSEIGIPREPIVFWSDTINMKKSGITLENTLFSFLFSHKHGAYDEKNNIFLIHKISHGNNVLSFILIQTVLTMYVRRALGSAIFKRNFKNMLR